SGGRLWECTWSHPVSRRARAPRRCLPQRLRRQLVDVSVGRVAVHVAVSLAAPRDHVSVEAAGRGADARRGPGRPRIRDLGLERQPSPRRGPRLGAGLRDLARVPGGDEAAGESAPPRRAPCPRSRLAGRLGGAILPLPPVHGSPPTVRSAVTVPSALRGASGEGSDPAEANRKVVDPFRWNELSAADVRLLASLYDGEVAYLDHELARLFAALDRRGVLRDAIVVVTADHGEEFKEHELMGHGFGLYNQELRVPLIVAGRGVPAGRVVDDDVSLVDVAPTIL